MKEKHLGMVREIFKEIVSPLHAYRLNRFEHRNLSEIDNAYFRLRESWNPRGILGNDFTCKKQQTWADSGKFE